MISERANTICMVGMVADASLTHSAITLNRNALAAMYRRPSGNTDPTDERRGARRERERAMPLQTASTVPGLAPCASSCRVHRLYAEPSQLDTVPIVYDLRLLNRRRCAEWRTRKRAGAERKTSAYHAHLARLDGSLESSTQGLADEGTRHWNQAEKTRDIGQEAGRQQEGSGNEDHQPVDQLRAGQTSSGELALNCLPCGEAFALGEPGANQCGHQYEGDSRPEADSLPSPHQHDEVEHRNNDKQREQAAKHDSAGE